jgi:hypothetical protein
MCDRDSMSPYVMHIGGFPCCAVQCASPWHASQYHVQGPVLILVLLSKHVDHSLIQAQNYVNTWLRRFTAAEDRRSCSQQSASLMPGTQLQGTSGSAAYLQQQACNFNVETR